MLPVKLSCTGKIAPKDVAIPKSSSCKNAIGTSAKTKQFIKSFNKYYKDRIANTERNYSIISKTHQKLERYCDEIENRPFGAIYLGEVDKLLDSDEMKNCEAIIRKIDEQRQLLYVIHPNEDSTGGVLKAIPKKIISWGKSTKVLMMLYLICAIVALFARSDFVNIYKKKY